MAKVKVLDNPKRSCEQSLAFRATVSPPHLRRILPRPALAPLVGPSRAAVLRELITYPVPEALYERMARTALKGGEPHEIDEAIKKLRQRIADHQKGQAAKAPPQPLPQSCLMLPPQEQPGLSGGVIRTALIGMALVIGALLYCFL